MPVVDLLAPKKGERILDLGCGDGRLTTEIMARGADVVGLDSAEALLQAAHQRGLPIVRGDAQNLPFSDRFDAVFSNAALHWMKGPDKVIAAVHGVLKKGGRFVGEFGGHGNVAAVVTALLAVLARRGLDGRRRHPWYFPTAEEYGEHLAAAGFIVESIHLFPLPTELPGDLTDWIDTFGGAFLYDFPSNDRSIAVSEIINLLAPSLCDDKGIWTVDYVRLRFSARKA
jgi:SAM-dependent methyltransferase